MRNEHEDTQDELRRQAETAQMEQYKQRLDAEEGLRPFWARELSDRQWELVQHCRSYVNEGAHGLPGHQLMLIIDYMADELEQADITPEQDECRELNRWLRQTFGPIARGAVMTERVLSVVRHYVNQMGRWLREREDSL